MEFDEFARKIQYNEFTTKGRARIARVQELMKLRKFELCRMYRELGYIGGEHAPELWTKEEVANAVQDAEVRHEENRREEIAKLVDQHMGGLNGLRRLTAQGGSHCDECNGWGPYHLVGCETHVNEIARDTVMSRFVGPDAPMSELTNVVQGQVVTDLPDTGPTTGSGVQVRGVPTCEWYLLCSNPAPRKVHHPVLGDVPCCERCRAKHNFTYVDEAQSS